MIQRLLTSTLLAVVAVLVSGFDPVSAYTKFTHDITTPDDLRYLTNSQSWKSDNTADLDLRNVVVKLMYPGDLTGSNQQVRIFDGRVCLNTTGASLSFDHGGGEIINPTDHPSNPGNPYIYAQADLNCTGNADGGTDDVRFRVNYDICSSTTYAVCTQNTSGGMLANDWSNLVVPSTHLNYDATTDTTSAYLHVRHHSLNEAYITNAFKVDAIGGSAGAVGLDNLAGNDFSITLRGDGVGRTSGSTSRSHTVEYDFAAPCDYTGSLESIEWLDADWGSDWDGPASAFTSMEPGLTLTNITTGAVIYSLDDEASMGGFSQQSTWMGGGRTFSVNPGDKFRITIEGYTFTNGMQFRVPFDGPDANYSCDPTDVEGDYDFHVGDCSATNGGYLYDNEDFSQSINAKIYIDGNLELTVPANQPSNGAGDPGGNHRFTFDIPNKFQDGGTYNLVVRGEPIDGGPDVDIVNGSRSFSCLHLDATCSITSFPSLIPGGPSGEVFVELTNTGSTTWSPADYKLTQLDSNDWSNFAPDVPSAAPGATVSFNFTISSPTTGGTFDFQRQLEHRPSNTKFGAICDEKIDIDHVRTAICLNVIGLPTEVGIGEAISGVRVRFRNTGSQSWTSPQYALVSQGHDWGPDSRSISTPVNPGGAQTFNLPAMTAPGTIGSYNFEWAVTYDDGSGQAPITATCQRTVEVTNRWIIQKPEGVPIPRARQPGDPWEANITIENTGSGDSFANGTSGSVDVSYAFSYSGTPAAWSKAPDNNLNITGGDTWAQTLNFTIPAAAVFGDEFCVTVTAANIEGDENGSITNAGTRVSDPICVVIAEQPYFEVHGGGISAGGELDPNISGTSWCSPLDLNGNPDDPFDAVPARPGYIRSVLIDSTLGAFSEFAAMAREDITGFGTTLARNDDLKFQSTSGNPGFFHTLGSCVTDYYNHLNKTGSAITPIGFFPNQSGQYFVDAGGPGNNYNLGAIDLSTNGGPSNRQVTLIVNGDVTITGNITNGNYTANMSNNNPDDDIPAFILVASGSINIVGSVTQLDGLYVARGDGGGAIDTCSDGPARLTTNDCTNTLIVKGSFVADTVHLRRTSSGTLRQTTTATITKQDGTLFDSKAAEIFIHTPEFNLALTKFASNRIPGLQVSQITDLPPIY